MLVVIIAWYGIREKELSLTVQIFYLQVCFFIVEAKVMCISLTDMPVQPSVIVPSTNVKLTINSYNFSLKCQPFNNNLHYLWEKRNSTLPSRAHNAHSSTLTITYLRPEDSGEYRCTVSNSTGRLISDYVKVIIEGNYVHRIICFCTWLHVDPHSTKNSKHKFLAHC